MAHLRLAFFLLLPLVGLTACGSDSPEPESNQPSASGVSGEETVPMEGATDGQPDTMTDAAETAETNTDMVEPEPALDPADYAIPMVKYSWDPMAGDASVSAEDGGPGFTGEGWETLMEFPAIGSAEAIKGGTITMYIPEWPVTLRLEGENWNTSFNYRANDLCMESLVQSHPTTLETITALATHWWISEDKMTYRFRINPKARWSDGKEVTADDVVATYKLKMDPGINMPSNILVFGKLNEPKALSKYIVEVTCKQLNWRNFMYFGGMGIMPAHQISIPGGEYLDLYQNKYPAMTGPYTCDQDSMEMNKSIDLVRRNDWWDKDNPAWMGLWNFDRYHFVVVQDLNLALEKAKAGELDYYPVNKSQWWVEELVPTKVDAIKRGLIQKRKFYNHNPVGTSGLAINTTRAPLDDLRVRKALGHLRDRPTMIDKLFFNEYYPLVSYYQNGDGQNPNNVMVDYDPFRAVELLEEAGWTALGSDGIRIKNGERLSFKMMYRSALSEPSLTVYKEDCFQAGIEIKLELVDNALHWKNVRERQSDIASMAWGALIFPNPETSYSSKLAAPAAQNNNITSFANARVDELLDEYDVEFNVARRNEIIREIDGIVYNEHPYVLDWFNPAQRVFYWNKFGMPKWGVMRFKDQEDMMYTWWVDPIKAAQLEKAKKDTSMTLETVPMENRFWQGWMKVQTR